MFFAMRYNLFPFLALPLIAFGQDLFLSMRTNRMPDAEPAKCTVYQNKSTNCESDCGSCFNPGSKQGFVVPGSSTGYYAPSNVGDTWVGACIDWSFGSQSMQKAEASFNTREKDNVYFGIGTYGTNDAQRGLGACFRLKVDTLDRDLLVQSVNTGSDVSGNQFDLQQGDGGTGAFNNCAGHPGSMFPGDNSVWGHQYGGVDHRAECAKLPHYTQKPEAMKAAGDDLVTLCEYSFDKKVRGEGGSNPTLLDASRVKCPPELVELTGIQRSDDPSSYVALNNNRIEGYPNAHKCQVDQPGGTTAFCLTRMMDCRKPSGAFKDNIKSSLVVPGRRLVQPCLPDGYTRVDVQCGCQNCYC
jgi:hypothetical protein